MSTTHNFLSISVPNAKDTVRTVQAKHDYPLLLDDRLAKLTILKGIVPAMQVFTT